MLKGNKSESVLCQQMITQKKRSHFCEEKINEGIFPTDIDLKRNDFI